MNSKELKKENLLQSTKVEEFDKKLLMQIAATVLTCIGRLLTSSKTKASIAKKYGIDKRTLQNWIDCFCLRIDSITYKNASSIDFLIWLEIQSVIGTPNKSMVLTKAAIIKVADCDYKTLSQNINLYIKKKEFDERATKISKYPPKIAKDIVEHLG